MEVNINIGDRGMLYIPIKKKNITIHIKPEKWDVCEFVEEINPAMVYLLLEKKLRNGYTKSIKIRIGECMESEGNVQQEQDFNKDYHSGYKGYLKECINSLLNKFDQYNTKREDCIEELCKKLEQLEDIKRKGGKK